MTAKEYLGQAFRIDQRINSKIEQVSSLHALATKATSTLSDMPGGATRNIHQMEDVIIKMMEMEDEINKDITRLMDLKKEIAQVIHRVENLEYQTLLELRYLCFKTWEQIAVEMRYGIDNIYRMHKKALEEICVPKTIQ